jgi:hypothetical protein
MPKPEFDPRMLQLLTEIYKREPAIRNEMDVYRYFAGFGEVDAEFEDLVELMQGLENIRKEFGFRSGLQGAKKELPVALKEVLAISKNRASRQETDYANGYLSEFFYIYLPKAGSCEVKARVAIHITGPYVKNALRVARALASGRDTLHSFKVAGPEQAGRTDQIIVYLCSPKDLAVVEDYLKRWGTADCIGGDVPPAMKRVWSGLGVAQEPPNVPKSYVTEGGVTIKNPDKYDPQIHPVEKTDAGFMPKNNQRMSFAEFHSHRIWAGLVQWRDKYCGTSNQTIRFHRFLYEVYLAYGRKKVDLKRPYLFPERENALAEWRKDYFMKNWKA